MNAMGKLGSYISRGVYAVSGPFNPFSGGVDIIVVQQPDGSFKSSPWYIRFFQGVFKTNENIISISVNGVEAGFHMYLDHDGEAHFLKESDTEEGEVVILPQTLGGEREEKRLGNTVDEEVSILPQTSGSEREKGLRDTKVGEIGISIQTSGGEREEILWDAHFRNIQSCKNNGSMKDSAAPNCAQNGKTLTRMTSRRSRILELLFGGRSMKESELNGGVNRVSSLERAEIAADLLELKWSTNLPNSNGFPKKPTDKKDFLTKKSTSKKEGKQQTHPLDVEQDCDGKTDYSGGSLVDNFGTGIVGIEHFEERTNCDSTNLSEEELVIEMNSSRRVETALRTVAINQASQERTSRTSNVGDKFEGDSEVPVDISSVGLHENFELTDSVTSDAQTEPSHNGAFLGGKVPAEFRSSWKAGLPNFYTGTSYDDVVIEKLSQEIGRNITSCSSPNNRQEKDIYLHPSFNGLLMSDQKTGSDSESKAYCIGNFHDFLNESSQLNKIGSFEKNEVKPLRTSPITIPRNKSFYEESHISPKSLPSMHSDIHDLERSHRAHPLSSSLDVIFEKTKGGLSRLKCSNTLDMEDGSQSKVVEEDFCTYEAVASILDTKYDHVQGIAIQPVLELSLCRHMLCEGMGLGAASQAFDSEKITVEKFHALDPSLLKNKNLVARIGGHYLPWNSAAPIVFGQEPIFDRQDVILVECVEKNGKEDSSLTRVLPDGSGNLWPFGFGRSKTIKFVESTDESINQVKSIAAPTTTKRLSRDNNGMRKPKNMTKKVRWLSPSSEELASLNLKEGPNLVTFRFSTAMLRQQQVDARIYLWKWNTQIVISDVDGTITRSDVLGQFMPLVGMDWSQTGVAHLFSSIKENGYQLLFLSARAISQANLTRQFLFKLKQDGKELPHGPVVISPDGLFPSLYREVIRRAPHEFKISCLEAIKALFPVDCNPFYAGFGNRDTDEVSYLKVGIPRGKIFIINPKGEVAVNRRTDTNSYTSLHALVNGMFPPMSSREQEDFNSWNFWKMPLPEIAI